MSVFRGSFAVALTALFAWLVIPGAAASTPSAAAGNIQAEAFVKSAEGLYEACVRGDVRQVRTLLRETETRFRALPMQRIVTAEGVEALARSIARLKRAVAAVSGDGGTWAAAAGEIRLAADAIAHPGNPLWQRYRAVLAEDVDSIGRELALPGTSRAALERLGTLKEHYAIIRTSVLLGSEPYVAERADSVLRYADRVLNAVHPDARLLTGLTASLKEAMDGLFPAAKGKDEAALAAPMAGPPWGWSAMIGTFIVTVLSWAGWQRYRHMDPVTPRGNLPRARHERHG